MTMVTEEVLSITQLLLLENLGVLEDAGGLQVDVRANPTVQVVQEVQAVLAQVVPVQVVQAHAGRAHAEVRESHR